MPESAAFNYHSGTDMYHTPQPTAGKLGDHNFESRAADARAGQQGKPDPAPRKLLGVVSGDNSRKADSGGCRTPESGIAMTPRSSLSLEGLKTFDDASSLKGLNPFDSPTSSNPSQRNSISDGSDDSDRDEGGVFNREAKTGIPMSQERTLRNATPVVEPNVPLYSKVDRSAGYPAPVQASRIASAPSDENIYHHIDGDRTQARPIPPNSPIPSAPVSACSPISDGTNAARHTAPRRALLSGALPAMAAPTRAAAHPEVESAFSSLRAAVDNAAAEAPASLRKASQPTGTSRLRALMTRTRRHSQEPLYDLGMDLFKALVPHTGVASSKQRAAALAALTQRGADEGYDALVKQLVERTLEPRLHSLPFKTLYELARLKDSDDKTCRDVLLKTGDLLGANKKRQTRKVEQAGKQLDVASALLSAIGELCHEHARAMSWDRQVSVALEAADSGKHEQLDAALREMWSGDLLMGEVEDARVHRLMNSVERLPTEQQKALATMLGLMEQTDPRAQTFKQFQEEHLPRLEYDEAIRGQLNKFVTHLRVATSNVLQLGTGIASDSVQTDYPAAARPPKAITTGFSRFGTWVAASFRRRPTRRDAVKQQVKQAVQTLIDGGRPTGEQIDALRSANQQLNGKLGQVKSAFVLHALVQDRLSKLDPDQLARLDVNLATARKEVSSLGQEGETLRPFYDELDNARQRESGIRRGAAAVTEIMEALPRSRHPEKLLQALNTLADAECRALNRQSELDFYEDALRRLDPKARKMLNKRLNGRDGTSSYAKAIDGLTYHEPSAWSHYRSHQLDTLARAVRV